MKAYTSVSVLGLLLLLAAGRSGAQEDRLTSAVARDTALPSAPAKLRVKDVTDWSRRAIRVCCSPVAR